jgi:hypothetical protein
MKHGLLLIPEFQLLAIKQCTAAGMADLAQMRQRYPDKSYTSGFPMFKSTRKHENQLSSRGFFGKPLPSGWAKNVSAI